MFPSTASYLIQMVDCYGHLHPPKWTTAPDIRLKFWPRMSEPNAPSNVPPAFGPSKVPWISFTHVGVEQVSGVAAHID